MFIFILVLMVLNISRVLLKPTIAESELDGILVDEETRSKRQTQFYNLLHQSLEKYANCANEHLAPLRALPNYKQYETFVYPKEYFQPAPTIEDNAANHKNKPTFKCSKVNLCSIEQQQTPRYNSNSPITLGKSQGYNLQNSQESRKHFPNISNGYARLPMYGSKHFGLRNIPPIYNPQYSHLSGRKNFTSSALNRSFYDKLLYRPFPAHRNKIVKIPIHNTKPGQMLASEHINVTPVNGIKSCTCSKVSSEKTPTHIPTNNTENVEDVKPTSISKTTEPETPLGSKQNNTTTTRKPKNCSCLKKTTAKPQNAANLNVKNTSTEPNSLLGIVYHNTTSSGEIETHNTGNNVMTHKPLFLATNDPQSNQNLNLLFLQLNTMAHNESTEDLKQILKKLNALKSALNITEYTTGKMESKTEPFSSTTAKAISTLKTTTSATSTETIKLHQATQLNYTNIDQSHSVLKTNNCYLQPNKSLINATVKHTVHTTNNSGGNTFQLLTALKDLNINLNTSDDITAITSSQLLQLNITSTKDLSRIINEMNTLVACLANKTTQENFQQHRSKSIDDKADIIVHALTNKDQLKNINLHVANSNDTFVSNHLHLNSNASTINSTISFSISSNGSFKEIKVEQQSPRDKHLKINKKENMNLNPYAEPISSEIYPAKRKFKTKPPQTIYWHRIEEKPLKLQENPSKLKNEFHLDDFDDDDEIDNENGEHLSTLLKECIDNEDLTESQEAESSEKVNHKPRFRDKCKHITSFT